MTPTPFTISVPQSTLDDLKERLARVRWPDEISGAGWEYGSNLSYLKDLVGYWQNGFDWRAQEQNLNRIPQFRGTVDGLGIHYLHLQGTGKQKIPLVLHDKIILISKILDALVITQQTSTEDSKSDDIDQAEWFLVDLIDHALD